MKNIKYIASLDLPELSPYRTLRRPEEHMREGIFVAEGEKVVRRLLATKITVRSLLVTPEWQDRLDAEENLDEREEMIVLVAEKHLLESIVGFNLHQGIMAVANIPPEAGLDEILRNAPPPRLLVALDNLANAENVGVVVRNCAAFGVHAILVGGASSSPYLRRAVRNSMGAVFHLPIHHTQDLGQMLNNLRTEHGFAVVATLPDSEQLILESDFSGDTTIIFGSEGTGISQHILAECTARVAVPMNNDTDSLNVGSASAVFLYEIQRQRGRAAAGRGL